MDTCHENKFDKLIKDGLIANKLSTVIVKSDGRFDNPFSTWRKMNLMDLAKWFTERSKTKLPKSRYELDKELPIMEPKFHRQDDNQKFRITWIGHASILIQVDKVNILTDPIFSNRAGPMSIIGPKRYRPPACNIQSLPPIDYVIVSHNHYDHFDFISARDINSRFGKSCRWLVPLGMGALLKSINIENYIEMDWWQKDCSCKHPARELGDCSRLAIYATPSQHWCKRSPFDYNKCLWVSYVVVSKSGETFYFAGDTGYCPAFKEIGDIFGPFEGAAIPIGAYIPRTKMLPVHVNPEEAVQMHRDLKSKMSIGIHHSTFALGKEYYKEPPTLISQLISEDPENKPFITLKHGQSVVC